MYSRQLEQLARQRGRELTEIPRARRTATILRTASKPSGSTARRSAGRGARRPLRSQTGWALVSIGLRIAASGNR